MGYNNIYRALKGYIKRDTGKAILFVTKDPQAVTEEDETLEQWLPKSQVKDMQLLKDGSGDCIIMLTEWILKQKGWMHLPTYTSEQLKEVLKPAHPQVPSTPPAKSFVDMDDDIPY